MICLSAAPSNAKIIATAENMARAFDGKLTALYVKTKSADFMSDEDHARLFYHMKLAEQAGATIITVHSEDVPYQIAEFARRSGVTRLVIGRSVISYRNFFGKTTLTEKIIESAPNLDIHIIPDLLVENKYREQKKRFSYGIFPTTTDLMISMGILLIVTAISYICWHLRIAHGSIIAVYILGVFLTSVMTKSYACSIMSSFESVLVFNFLFTEPRFTFHAKEVGYLFTFTVMLVVSVLTATMVNRLKRHAKEYAQITYQTRVLLDTTQLLKKAKDDFEFIQIAATQLLKLLERNVVFFVEENRTIHKEHTFRAKSESNTKALSDKEEKEIVEWVFQNRMRAGCGTDMFSEAKYLYFAIHINHKVFGVVGIMVDKKPLDKLENNIVYSVLGECALAIENNRNAKEKEDAAVLARNEQLRADLLRSISHDFRTPLTVISGNANALILNGDKYDTELQKKMLLDIYDESIWLNNLVENLLSATRIEDGRMNLNISAELVGEVVQEALRHVNRNSDTRSIRVSLEDEFLLARMDSRLIVQVIINLVDNAIKYTSEKSIISITAKEEGGLIYISVADNGKGISQELKPHIFDMFFTGEQKIVDSHRSIGLGLALCKSIINAHGGEIELTDNQPHGCIFTFTLLKEEAKFDE